MSNYTRIPTAEYEAAIAAAEERGRASVASAPVAPSPATISPAVEQVRVTQIRQLPMASAYPAVVEQAIAAGLTVGEAAHRVLSAHAAGSASLTSAGQGDAPQFDAYEVQQYMSSYRLDESAARAAMAKNWIETAPQRTAGNYAAKLRAHIDTAARSGRTINAAQADAELQQLGNG